MITVFRKGGKITKVEADQAGKNSVYQAYSALMVKYEKAVIFMGNKKVPMEDKIAQVPRLKSLQEEISASLILLKLIGEDWEVHQWLK